jgi:FKBP-type peptidyl-prolyl cis-trans isomerase SlyD
VKIEADMMVSVAFRLFDANDALVDEVPASDPLVYLHGYAQVIPGLENGLAGAEVGEARLIVVLPDEAFGEHDPEARLEIDPDDFPDASLAEPGAEIVATGPDGVEAVHRILEVDEDAIVVDLNHPLAGQTIRFEVQVCGMRPATDDELESARADVGARIAHAGTVVYGSPSDDAAPSDGPLVQLRARKRTPEPHDS